MRIVMHGEDRFKTQSGEDGFPITVSACGYDGIRVESCLTNQYMEVRVKSYQAATFYFPTKRHKKDTDLGWWNDAEVVYSCNLVGRLDNMNAKAI